MNYMNMRLLVLTLLLVMTSTGCLTKSAKDVYYVRNGKSHIDKEYLKDFEQLDLNSFLEEGLVCDGKRVIGKELLKKVYPKIEASLQRVNGHTYLDYLVPQPTRVKTKTINNVLFIKIIYETVKDPSTLTDGGVEAVVNVCTGEVLFAVNFSPF